MLDRWGVIEGSLRPLHVKVVADLPEHLRDPTKLNAKRERDQRKLLAMVQYAKHEGDRKQFINQYFGVA